MGFRLLEAHMECGESGVAEKTYRRLIKDYPEFIDAYHHLAILLSETGREEEAFGAWQRAVAIGLDCLPGRFRMGEDLLPWGIHENRPFLRAFHALGLEYLNAGKIEGALEIMTNLLAMNPNDNQGVRGTAVGCNFTLNRPSDVLAICDTYPDDGMPELLYGRVLALHQLGRIREAEEALKMAFDVLPLAARELVKSRHRKPKEVHPGYITRGGADEAYYYWTEQGRHWKSTPDDRRRSGRDTWVLIFVDLTRSTGIATKPKKSLWLIRKISCACSWTHRKERRCVGLIQMQVSGHLNL
jgi:tetratricopeptide (TPR) repeat protein